METQNFSLTSFYRKSSKLFSLFYYYFLFLPKICKILWGIFFTLRNFCFHPNVGWSHHCYMHQWSFLSHFFSFFSFFMLNINNFFLPSKACCWLLFVVIFFSFLSFSSIENFIENALIIQLCLKQLFTVYKLIRIVFHIVHIHRLIWFRLLHFCNGILRSKIIHCWFLRLFFGKSCRSFWTFIKLSTDDPSSWLVIILFHLF